MKVVSGQRSVVRKSVFFFAVCFPVFVLCVSAHAQSKIPRVGILFMGGRDQPHLEAFKQGLREHGYSEGKNIFLEYRYAEEKYERLPDLAKEFVREKVDVIVTTRRSARRPRARRHERFPSS